MMYVFEAETVDKWKYCPICGAEILEVYPGDYHGHTTCMTDDCDGVDFEVVKRTTDAIQNGTIVISRKGGAIGRLTLDDVGFAKVSGKQRLGERTVQFSTFYEPISEVERKWRLATDEEVRRYFDAD